MKVTLIDQAIRAIAEKDRSSQIGHPRLATLWAYLKGQLASEQVEPLQDHLALCRRCADLTLELLDWHRQSVSGSLQDSAPRRYPRLLTLAILAAAIPLFFWLSQRRLKQRREEFQP